MIRLRGNHYDYQFIKDGKRYNGVCEGCSTKREAEAYEKRIKDTVATATKMKDVKVLVENFRDELTGGKKILLAQAYDLSLDKVHRKKASDRVIAQKRGVFLDFLSFMKKLHPDALTLNDVTPAMAEEYISMIRISGRFNKELSYIRNGRTITRPVKDTPSSRTANLYLTVCKEVFSLLAKDAGIMENPFAIEKASSNEENREAFTEAELRKIYQNLDSFTGPLFTIATMTALREGDICTLRWSDIDFDDQIIRRVMNKTGHKVEILRGAA